MKKKRGSGFIYQPVYKDKRTGEQKRAATWWIQYSVRGKRFRESSGSSSRADALNLLERRVGGAAQRGVVPLRGEKTTTDELAQLLIDDDQTKERKNRKRIKFIVAHLEEFFADTLAVDITRDRVSCYITYRARKKAPAAKINQEPKVLRRIFTLGKKVGHR
jgi:hypothetical protein